MNVAEPFFTDVGLPMPISLFPMTRVGAFSGLSTSPISKVPAETEKPRSALVGPSPFGNTVLISPAPLLATDVLTVSVPVPFRCSLPVPSLMNALVPTFVSVLTVTVELFWNTVPCPPLPLIWNPGISTSGPV